MEAEGGAWVLVTLMGEQGRRSDSDAATAPGPGPATPVQLG